MCECDRECNNARPYGEVLDEMDHEAKYEDHPVHEKMKLLAEALVTLKHARVFISTREKMHPTGIELYDDLIRRVETSST